MSAPENPKAFPGVAHFTGATHSEGMSLRDWFAGQALAGLVATEGDASPGYAYWLADQMLEAREKTNG